MADSETPTSDGAGYTPDFVRPRHGAITEDNWPEYEARGFIPIDGGAETLKFAQNYYGAANVYTGPVYDWDENRPLPHAPGISLYVSPEGREIADQQRRDWEEVHRRHQARSPDDLGGN